MGKGTGRGASPWLGEEEEMRKGVRIDETRSLFILFPGVNDQMIFCELPRGFGSFPTAFNRNDSSFYPDSICFMDWFL